MALSFEDSLNKTTDTETTVSNETEVMSLSLDGDDSASVASVSTFALSSSNDGWKIDYSYPCFTAYEDDNISSVDADKNITLNPKQINITQEENSQYIPFEMPRRYDGFDLSDTAISIHYTTSDEYHAAATPVNVKYSDDKIRFGWLVDSYVTHIAGNIQFEIQATGSTTDMNGNSYGYTWKSKPNGKLNVLQSICNSYNDGEGIKLDDTWVSEIVGKFADKVTDIIAEANIDAQVNHANTAATQAKAAATEAKQYADNASSAAENAVTAKLVDYATKTYVEEAIADVDVSSQLGDYAKTSDIEKNYYNKTHVDENFATIDYVDSLDISDQLTEYVKNTELETKLGEYYTKTQTDEKVAASLVGYATKDDVADAIAEEDITGKLGNYYTKAETNAEIDKKLENVSVDLTGYATESYVDDKEKSLSASIADNASGIASLNNSVAEINTKLESIDDSPRVTYDATYGDVEMEDGTTAEYMFTLWKTENGVREPQDRFQIIGGGGSGGGSVTLGIAYVEGYTTPIVATSNDSVIIKYNFTGEDSVGDTELDATASWKVGNRVVATEDIHTGINEFDITEHVDVGDTKVVLTVTHATGAMATKAWTIKVVDVRLESSFDDTKKNTANSPVNFTFTPYGSIAKTVHFLLDGVEIATKTSSAASSGLSDSYSIPAQEHGTHLFEAYMTAEINGKTVESNHIVKDIIWFDDASMVPVIGCTQQKFTARQYEATNISYIVYDPSTETPSISLKATYIDDNGDTVEEYSSNLVVNSSKQVWQYKSDVMGEHILTITCGSTVKTIIATIVDIGINVSPITTGLVFDFNPVSYSNNDSDRLWKYNDSGIMMTVSDNFDWVNGGYQIDSNGDKCFCIKAGTSAEINYELFGDDAKVNGKQFKLIFKTENVADSSTSFLSCVSDTMGDDKVGIDMKAHEATIYAKTDSLPLPYAEEEIIEFEFNITPSSEEPSMVMGYEDGVSTRPLVYDATHDFQQHKDHRKTISLGSNDCDLYIYRFKVYNTSLSDRDILNNFIADSRNAEEMISRYDRNQIYQDGILTPEHLAEVCPDLRIIKLEVPWFTQDKNDKVYDKDFKTIIECIYKNGDPVYDNWTAYDCVHSGQGTSSNNYGAAGRNLDLIMKPYKDYGNNPVITLGDGKTTTNKVSLTKNSVPTNYFNLKVNIASSENANNALLQRRYNEYNPYKRPFVREDESTISYIKDTMEFYNCVVFVKESHTDLNKHVEFADNSWHFYAMGNIGDSKKTDKTRLTDPTDQYECVLEVMDNTLPSSTMPTGKTDENGAPVYPIDKSEWTTGNSAYDALYGDTFDEASSKDKPNGLDDTYGWRYIYEDGTDEENAAARAYVENKWREFYEFVVTSTDEEFKTKLGDYCVLDSVMYYYLFTLRYTMTDNHAKNSFWHYGKTGDIDTEGNPIRRWDLCFAYDMDTALGIDNYGRMTYRYGYEEIDYVDGTKDWVWNAPQHVFFLRLRELFDAELCELYTRLESLGAWSATGLINQFNEWQSEFPEELWRLDIERKYIRTYTTSFINGADHPEFLKERANGRKKTQRAQFEKNQEKYMSSKFGGTVAASDDIIMRCSVPNTSLVVAPNFDMHLTPYSYVYLNVKYNTATPIKVRAVPNVEYTIKYDADLADIIEIYSASCLKSIGDLSSFYLTNGDFSNAVKIRELKLGNSTDGYDNTNVITLGLGSNGLLNKLDIQNMSGLTSSLDVSGLKNLEELYAFGSNVSGVIFADGGNISTAQVPAIGSLQMKNLSYLLDSGFNVSSYDKLTRLVAENSKLDLINLINNAPNLYQIRLIGIDWSLDDTTMLERLYGLAGVTSSGGNSDKSIISGKVTVPVIREQQLYNYRAAWPDLEIVFNSMINQYAVTFVNADGTVLDVQYVDEGGEAVDPITRENNPIAVPTKESTVSTEFTYNGWDSSFANIYSARTITATYTETIRSYTIKYVSMGYTMQETTATYGSYVEYNNETPTYTLAEESAHKYYLFNRWDKSGLVDGDKTITAVFDSFKYTEDAFTGREFSDLSPVEIYALTQLGLDNVPSITVEDGDPYSFSLGYDVNFDDVESEIIVSDRVTFDGSSNNKIDKGIKLFDEDKDFVIAVDYKFLSGNVDDEYGNMLLHCYNESLLSGFKLYYMGDSARFKCDSTEVSTVNRITSSSSETNREILVIRHKKGSGIITIYKSDTDSVDGVSTVEFAMPTSTAADCTLVLGCGKFGSDYSNGSFANVDWCKIWYGDIGEESCKKIACWPHEKVNMEVCGLKKYFLSDGSGNRCNITMIASNLMNRTMRYNKASTTANAWADSDLCNFLNTRIYDAMPTQMKAIIKNVIVNSSVGNKSTDIKSANCYVYIPAIRELSTSSTFKATPYSNEAGYTISYMVGDENRKRAPIDGDYAAYWTRSPNVQNASYVWQINAEGATNGYVNSSGLAGVLIQISL